MVRARRFCFTINNPTAEDEPTFLEPHVKYLVYVMQRGESGTPHYQGYVEFKSQKTLSAVSNLLPRAHLEVAKGTPAQASDYCTESDTNIGDPVIVGTPPASREQGKRTDLETASRELMDHRSMKRFAEEYPHMLVKYSRGFKELMAVTDDLYAHDDVRGIWCWGPPGTGKSRWAREEHPEAFLKAQNKWFDGYTGQEAIILDDLDQGGSCLGHYLKIWADRYACTGEIKGSTVNLRHHVFIITSNYKIEELWPEPEMQAAIKRRFKVKHFDKL